MAAVLTIWIRAEAHAIFREARASKEQSQRCAKRAAFIRSLPFARWSVARRQLQAHEEKKARIIESKKKAAAAKVKPAVAVESADLMADPLQRSRRR